jgi:hypothetical protein
MMDMVKMPLRRRQRTGDDNSVVAFRDNSSGIRGYRVPKLIPCDVEKPSPMRPTNVREGCVQPTT